MNCPKCGSIMKCVGVTNCLQDWYCETCGHTEVIEKELEKTEEELEK